MKRIQNVIGVEINPKFVGALFTEQIANTLRVFCFYTNGDTSHFDMPADDNLDNLKHFYSKLNIDENCSSLIVDDVVQGRVYVCSEGSHWLYTLLSAPGNVLPPFKADICNLPWRHCWRSKTADVLEYGKLGKSAHCFAIRTQISENDAVSLMTQSKAFTNPVSCQKKRPHRRLGLMIGIAMAGLAMVISLPAYYKFNQSEAEPLQPISTTEPAATTKAANYYLLNNHQVSGPYPGKTIVSMNAGGLLTAETMCRPENTSEWASLATVVPTLPTR